MPSFGAGQSNFASMLTNPAGMVPTSVVANAAANTKGSWAELSAATPYPASGFSLWIFDIDGNPYDYLIDIGIGAAGSEVVIVENLFFGGRSQQTDYWFHLPIPIPAGARVSARIQCSTGSSNVYVNGPLLVRGWQRDGLGIARCYGSNTATSGGVVIDAGPVAGVFGSTYEITPATSYPIRELTIGLSANKNLTWAANAFSFEVGIGPFGSEVTILSSLEFRGNTIEYPTPFQFGPFHVFIPAGTRIVVQAMSSTNVSPARVFALGLLGVG